jgi:hypothetical protein
VGFQHQPPKDGGVYIGLCIPSRGDAHQTVSLCCDICRSRLSSAPQWYESRRMEDQGGRRSVFRVPQVTTWLCMRRFYLLPQVSSLCTPARSAWFRSYPRLRAGPNRVGDRTWFGNLHLSLPVTHRDRTATSHQKLQTLEIPSADRFLRPSASQRNVCTAAHSKRPAQHANSAGGHGQTFVL